MCCLLGHNFASIASVMTGYDTIITSSECALVYATESKQKTNETSGYATWFTAGGAIRIAHYDVIDDVIIWVQDGNCKK